MDAGARLGLHRPDVPDGSLYTPDLPFGDERFASIAELFARRACEDADLIVRARTDPNAFVEAIARIEGQVWVGRQAAAHRMWHDHFSRAGALGGASMAVLLCAVSHGKAIPEDTPIKVPGGWREMGALTVGDHVIGGDGKPTEIVGASPTWTDHELVELEFGGARLTCDLDHLWRVRPLGGHPETLPTRTIVDNFDLGWSIPLVGGWRAGERRITGWASARTVPVRCITVAAAHHTYVAGEDELVTHNSLQIHRWRVLWELGKNPNLRILLMSATSQLPEKMLSGIKADIEHNPFVQAVFPHLRPGRKAGQQRWSNDAIHVERADNLTDPSIECAGLTTKILGSRKDLIVIDDLLNTENTLTPYMRKQVWDRVQAEALSRRPPHLPSRVWFLGHPWTEDDGLAQACQQPGVRVLRAGARVQRNDSGRIITSADDGWNELLPWVPLLPELWKKDALVQRIKSLGWAARFMIDCLFMRKGSMGFSPEALGLALMNGRGIPFVSSWNPISTGCETYTGVDLSTGEGDDETVILTAAKIPATGRRRILEIQSGKWTGPEIVERIHDTYRRFKSVIAVENNGAQKYIRQFVRDDSAHITPVLDHHTGTNKHALNWGIKHMELELGAPGRWLFPRPQDIHEPISPEMKKLVDGALAYSGDAKHTSDYVMAWWICWLAMAKDEGTSLK